jgi:hypothetical protein
VLPSPFQNHENTIFAGFDLILGVLEAAFGQILIALSCVLLCYCVSVEHSITKEEKLKAAYLVNFTSFISWRALVSGTLPYKVQRCAEASNFFFHFWRQPINNKRFDMLQRTLDAVSLKKAVDCEFRYVSQPIKALAEQLDNTVVVAHSSCVDFSGTATIFHQKNKRLRFEIYLKKIKPLNIIASSELLKWAKIE